MAFSAGFSASELLGARVRAPATFHASSSCSWQPATALAEHTATRGKQGGKRRAGGSKAAKKAAIEAKVKPQLSEDGKYERWRVFDVKLPLDADEATELQRQVRVRPILSISGVFRIPPPVVARVSPCALSPGSIKDMRNMKIVRRAFDARKEECKWTYVVDVDMPAAARLRERQNRTAPAPPPNVQPSSRVGEGHTGERVVVVGAGPAGLFAALRLARAGLKVTLLDRGKPVERRGADIGSLFHRAKLNAESNLCYGEGGAGTWSDGKLTTRVHAGEVRTVLETLVEFGAPEHILTEGKPHLGTDRLVKILKGFRAALLELGVDVRFDSRMEDLEVGPDGAVRGVAVSRTGPDGESYPVEHLPADRVVLAVGHSARDVYERLRERGVAIAPKAFAPAAPALPSLLPPPFPTPPPPLPPLSPHIPTPGRPVAAVGFRIEHPQELINRIQYGAQAAHPAVPVADYRLATQVEDGRGEERAVYSFCMCPGGQIVVTSTTEEELCLNGMSFSRRDSRWANSALVVSVAPGDFAEWGGADPQDPLAGVAFQRAMERKAAALGGGAFRAPAQLATDFMEGRPSQELPKTRSVDAKYNYRLGVASQRCDEIFAPPVTEALRAALLRFDRSMPGFLCEHAVLHGVETRTSAPVQITRDGASLQSLSTPGLYPSGEGRVRGGIVSAAVDGLRIAERIVAELAPSRFSVRQP
eukprot:tig00021525_g22125.t1